MNLEVLKNRPYINIQRYSFDFATNSINASPINGNISIIDSHNSPDNPHLGVGNNSALRIAINLSEMPDGEKLYFRTRGRDQCYAFMLSSLNIQNGQVMLNMTIDHNLPSDPERRATVSFVNSEAESEFHTSTRRNAFFVYCRPYKKLETALNKFAGNPNNVTIVKCDYSDFEDYRGDNLDLLVTLERSGSNVNVSTGVGSRRVFRSETYQV